MTRPRPASRPPCRHRFAPRRRRTARPAHAADRRRAPERLLLAVLREPLPRSSPGLAGSALFTEATLVSRVSAVSCAENPSTSRRIRTARWFAAELEGRDERAPRLALLIAGVRGGVPPRFRGSRPGRARSRPTPPTALRRRRRVIRGRPIIDREDSLRPPPDCVERGVGGDPIQPRAQRARPSNVGSAFQARNRASCRASSASWTEPSIR